MKAVRQNDIVKKKKNVSLKFVGGNLKKGSSVSLKTIFKNEFIIAKGKASIKTPMKAQAQTSITHNNNIIKILKILLIAITNHVSLTLYHTS